MRRSIMAAAVLLGTSLLVIAPASIAAAAPAPTDPTHPAPTDPLREFHAHAFYPDNALAIARGKLLSHGCTEVSSFVIATGLPSPDRYRAVVTGACSH
jgi:hypothetical protein